MGPGLYKHPVFHDSNISKNFCQISEQIAIPIILIGNNVVLW